jgi:hypothetical protein
MRLAGPEDPWNPEVNGDPDSTVGEEDDLEPNSFDEMADWPDEDDEDDEDGDDEDGDE